MIKLFSLSIGLFALLSVTAAGEAEKPADSVVYSKPLASGDSIVVVRGPSVSTQRMRELCSVGILGDTDELYPIRLELWTHDGEKIPIWSRLKRENQFEGFDVLDMRVEPNRIIVATVEFSTVMLWSIDMLSNTASVFYLDCKYWTAAPGPIVRDRRDVGALLSWAPDTHHLRVEVNERGFELNQRTVFEQVGDSWKFKVLTPGVRIPATAPADGGTNPKQ